MSEATQRGRGRPLGGRAFEQSDVIDAALEAIAIGGYAGLSMRGVARSLGASLATVQRHFATKDELWRGSVDAFIDGFNPAELDWESGDVLTQRIDRFLERGGDHPGLVIALLTDKSPGHEERFAHIADRLADRHAATEAFLDGLKTSGQVRDIDVKALLLLINVGIGAIASAPVAARDTFGFDIEEPADRARLAGALADILRSGIAAD